MIELKDYHFILDGKPFYVYSGELHYFRMPPAMWDVHLRRAKEAGLNTVSSYIPWSWHEAAEGQFDFTGKTHPQRNLVGYLKKVQAHGLKFMARVGPVSNAEMVNEGIPGWLLDNYPEVFVRGKEVTNLPHVTLLSYLNDTFLKFVGRWYEKVLPVVAQYRYPEGNIILVQLDNEIGMVHWLNKAPDYSAGTEKMYRQFLQERYSSIEALNRAYGTSYADFGEIAQPSSGRDDQPKNLLWDWMNFYQYYYARYFNSLYEAYGKSGVGLPVLANIPQFYDFDVRGRGVFSPMTTMMFRDFRLNVPDVIFGGAYQMRRLDYENYHDITLTTEVVKMVTSPGIPSVCAELQTGIMRDRPKLYPQDVELNLKTSTASGLNAVNCYMFSGGKNLPEFGAFGTYHEWQSAVSSKGEKREHFEPMAGFGRLIKTFGGLIAQTTKRCDTAIGFYPPIYTTEYLTGPDIERWEWDKMQLFYDGLARLLQIANINFTFVDIQRASPEELAKQRSLWVFSLDFMDAETQKKLADYVAAGGVLILNPDIPVKDLAMKKCTILADYLSVGVESSFTKKLFFYIGKNDYLAQGRITAFSHGADAKIVATYAGGKPCGLNVSKDGGKALILGFGLNHMFDYHRDLILEFARMAGVKPSVKVDDEISAIARSAGSHGFLFLGNFHDTPRETKVRMVLPGETRESVFPVSGKIKLHNRSCSVLALNVPLPWGDKLRYSTVEILEIKKAAKGGSITVSGCNGCQAEMEIITSRRKISVDGKSIPVKTAAGRIRVNFVLNGKDQIITLL
ncbi:MAG: hypothetical protein A2219_04855 [Elusimicrobia bacterium RIFOXYA2_FULL_50_26]|nr:MAG: hypothetical protein A2219_04855 [Elusimicrobia bacterium RIFOXYA2_FULL_50_26]OGS23366.1 MAG: hypothetical protein A2314_08150 [Elusimicrobia bacterium RIFOXYB2_FULL_50_12]